MNAKEIFEKLVERAIGWGLLSSSRRHGKPGELIERLPAEEREELQNLKAKDAEKPVFNLMYLQGQYGENTTTVHKIFPNKKDEDEHE